MKDNDSIGAAADDGGTTFEANAPNLLRKVALVAAIVGAAGSVGLTLYVGRHNPSVVLMGLFVIWVSSPFAALILAGIVSKRWQLPNLTAIHFLTIAVAIGSLAIYAYTAFGPPRPTPAFVFLVVPFVLWLLTALSLLVSVLVSRRRSN